MRLLPSPGRLIRLFREPRPQGNAAGAFLDVLEAARPWCLPLAVDVHLGCAQRGAGLEVGAQPKAPYAVARAARLPAGLTLVPRDDTVTPVRAGTLTRADLERWLAGLLAQPCAQADHVLVWRELRTLATRCSLPTRERPPEQVTLATTHGDLVVGVERSGPSGAVSGPRGALGSQPPVALACVQDDHDLRLTIELHWSPWAEPEQPGFARVRALVSGLERSGWELDTQADLGKVLAGRAPPTQAPPAPTPRGHDLIPIAGGRVRLGLDERELDRLTDMLAAMEDEERAGRTSLKGFDDFDPLQAAAVRREWLALVAPAREVELVSFFIDRHPVTNAQWAGYVEASGIAPPPHWPGGRAPAPPDHFVTGVSWQEADAYARYYGLRLPTEAQWERAARGAEGRFYPWGNDWRPGRRLVLGGISYPPGQIPALASPFGVQDLVGEHGEWCEELFAPAADVDAAAFARRFPGPAGRRVVRGGLHAYFDLTCFSRIGVLPDEHRRLGTFRCVR